LANLNIVTDKDEYDSLDTRQNVESNINPHRAPKAQSRKPLLNRLDPGVWLGRLYLYL